MYETSSGYSDTFRRTLVQVILNPNCTSAFTVGLFQLKFIHWVPKLEDSMLHLFIFKPQ